MKHLQFLNSKQQDSHGNFVSQLNKIFNKKYSLKNDLYRIYSNNKFANLINRYMLQFVDNDLEKFVMKNPANQVFDTKVMDQAKEDVIKHYLRTKGSYVSSAMDEDAMSDFLKLVNFAENKNLAFRWRYQNVTFSKINQFRNLFSRIYKNSFNNKFSLIHSKVTLLTSLHHTYKSL